MFFHYTDLGLFRTDCGFSPHGEFVFTATSHKDKSGERGALLFFDSESLELLYRIDHPNQVCGAEFPVHSEHYNY